MEQLVDHVVRAAADPRALDEALDVFVSDREMTSAVLFGVAPARRRRAHIHCSAFFRHPTYRDMLSRYTAGDDEGEEPLYALLSACPTRTFIDEWVLRQTKTGGNVPNTPLRAEIEASGIAARGGFVLNRTGPTLDVLSTQHASLHELTCFARRTDHPTLCALFERSLEIGRVMSALRTKYGAGLGALDYLQLGVVLTNEHRHILYANPEANRILALDDGLGASRDGRLVVRSSEVDGALAAAIEAAIGSAQGIGAVPPAAFDLIPARRRSSEDRFVLSVAPLKDTLGELSPGLACAFVLIVDSATDQPFDTAALAQLGELSEAEAETLDLLAKGLNLRQISEARDVKYNTARNQTRSLSTKLRCKTQDDVQRLAALTHLPLLKPPAPPPPGKALAVSGRLVGSPVRRATGKGQISSDLVDSVLGAALSPALWEEALDIYARDFELTSATVFAVENSVDGRNPVYTSAFARQDTMRAALNRFQAGGDPCEFALCERLFHRKPLALMDEQTVFGLPPGAELPASPFRDALAELGLVARSGVVLNRTGPRIDVLAAQHGSFEEQRAFLARGDHPPVARLFAGAVEIGRTMAALQAQFQGALAVLDRLALGVVLADADRRVIHANEAAKRLLGAGEGLALSPDGRLRASTAKQNASLSAAISLAGAPAFVGDDAPDLLLIGRPPSKRPLILSVNPIRDVHGEMAQGLRCALVMIVDPDAKRPIDTRALAALGRLSDAEAKILEGVAKGLRYSEMGRRRGTNAHTVKKQFWAVAHKLRCRTRAEVLRLAALTELPLLDGAAPPTPSRRKTPSPDDGDDLHRD